MVWSCLGKDGILIREQTKSQIKYILSLVWGDSKHTTPIIGHLMILKSVICSYCIRMCPANIWQNWCKTFEIDMRFGKFYIQPPKMMEKHIDQIVRETNNDHKMFLEKQRFS